MMYASTDRSRSSRLITRSKVVRLAPAFFLARSGGSAWARPSWFSSPPRVSRRLSDGSSACPRTIRTAWSTLTLWELRTSWATLRVSALLRPYSRTASRRMETIWGLPSRAARALASDTCDSVSGESRPMKFSTSAA